MDSIVFGPGIMGFYGLVGVCEALHENDMSKQFKYVSGSSAGALAAFLFIAIKMGKPFKKVIFDEIMKDVKMSITTLPSEWGLIKKKDWNNVLEYFFEKLDFPPGMTLLDFHNLTGTTLFISAFDVNSAKTVYFSHESHPNVRVIDVLRASTAVPLLFPPVKINGAFYIDAATLERFPTTPFIGKPPESVLTVGFADNLVKHSDSEITGLIQYIKQIFTSLASTLLDRDDIFQKNRIILETDIDLSDFNMDMNRKLELYMLGLETTYRALVQR